MTDAKRANPSTPKSPKSKASAKSKQKGHKSGELPLDDVRAPLVVPGVVPVVFLDANILIPQSLRLVFLELAEAGLIQTHWSEEVLIETRRNLIRPDGPYGLNAGTVDRMLKQMRKYFPQALVHGHEKLKRRFVGKTDPKDEHVAAGAFKRSQSSYAHESVVLVTSNLADLPQSAFADTKVHVSPPGRFLTELLANQPTVADIIDKKLRSLLTPRTSREDFLQIMDNAQCQMFSDALAEAWGLSPI
jgi:hypothetical protein